MKTTIIQIESHDDLISVKDKMSWYSCQRMILVWPKKGRLVTGFLDLVLIKRTAQSLGSEIALVTHNSQIRENAESLKIPVFQSIPRAEKSVWAKDTSEIYENKYVKGFQAIEQQRLESTPKKRSLELPKLVKILTMGICFLAISSLFLFLMPKATITLYPLETAQEVEINVMVSSSFTGITPNGGLPGLYESMEISGELSRKSSGTTIIPTTKAMGEVVFTNLTENEVTIPAQTVLGLADPGYTSYVTMETVIVPGGKTSGANVSVEALEGGPIGNVAEQQISTIMGGLGELVAVTNENAITGGGGISVPTPDESSNN